MTHPNSPQPAGQSTGQVSDGSATAGASSSATSNSSAPAGSSAAASGSASARADCPRTGLTAAALKQAFVDNLRYAQARFPEVATRNDLYMALAYAVRDRLLHRWITTANTYLEQKSRTVCYFSAEYLLGPHLGLNLLNLDILETAEQALRELGHDLAGILAQEEEPGLGHGGLGRLAACYMESLATLKLPAIGYGIRYEFGIFDQAIRDGWQVEITDKWLRYGNPWEIPRPEIAFDVPLGGHVEHRPDAQGRVRAHWLPERVVRGVAHDTPILGYGVPNANLLRLWKAEAVESFDFQAFNQGDYYRAVEEKARSENITKVLYPNDAEQRGKQLRLEQQFLLVSCSLQDMLRIYRQRGADPRGLAVKFTAQLNDTHPALAVAELTRLLVDVHGLEWDEAWNVTRAMFAYTNHTLLPEALEKWPVDLFGGLLPRHLEIVYEINRRFLDGLRARYPGDLDKARRLSLIDETGPRHVRMAHLACVGGHAVNGVSALHSDLLRQDVLRDFCELEPAKFLNVTNGVSPRRFLLLSNPRLAALITDAIGPAWRRDLMALRALEPLADDVAFQTRWRQAKLAAKAELAALAERLTGVKLDPAAMFDVQVKRIHEYKRQHLNALRVITLYNELLSAPNTEAPPRVFLFAGKAAPGYHLAKLIIKLIHAVADVVNGDARVAGRLRVAFLPDFNVTLAQRIYPAADLAEQISTAGKEASGTGNMKFMLNGAVTIGTLDGANIEIRDRVGPDNFFEFGLTAAQAQQPRGVGFRPYEVYRAHDALRLAIDQLAAGHFSRGDRELFRPLLDSLLLRDDYLVLADFAAYARRQQDAAEAFADARRFARMSIMNTARAGWFSADRSIQEYADKVWRVKPVEIKLE